MNNVKKLRPNSRFPRVCALALLLISATALPALGLVAPSMANTAVATIEIQTVDLRETGRGAELTVLGNGPLVWTQYRNDAGDLVVELPNTVLAGEVIPPAPRGVVSSVVLEPEGNSVRPMTRLVVSTNVETEHTLFGNDEVLTLTFGTSGAPTTAVPSTTAVAEPAVYRPSQDDSAAAPSTIGAASAAATMVKTEPAVAVRPMTAPATPIGSAGSPEEPIAGPTPQGVRATRLLGVEVVDIDGRVALRVNGDGEFLYSTFTLENPRRFVIDLEGVVNSAPQSRVDVGRSQVDQVRLAQFRPYPTPVSRVVLDLVGDAMPVLDGSAEGLWVRFAAPGELLTDLESDASEAPNAAQDDEPTDMASTDMPTEASEGEAADSMESADVIADAEGVESGPQTVPALSEIAEPSVTETTDVASLPSDEPSTAIDFEAETAAPVEPMQEPVDVAAAPVVEPVVTQPEFAPAEPELAEAPVASEPLFADEPEDPFADDPLEITDETQFEAPTAPMNDVALFEAQEVSSTATEERRNDSTQGFAVQRLDTNTQWVGEPITLTVKDADLSEVLRTIARYAELNLVVQPGISAPVTVEFIAVPWDQALDSILKINRLDKELQGNILRVAQKDLFRQEAVEDQELAQARALSVPLSTVIKRLSYAEAQSVSQILTRGQQAQGAGARGRGPQVSQETGILSRRGSVNVDRRTNTLIIKELPGYLDTVIQVIENLDIPEKQVMIEARIVETTRNFSRSLGIDWSLGGAATAATGNTTGLQFPNRVEAGGGVQLLTGGDNGFFNLSLGNVLNTLQIDLALQAAENEGLINVISSPKIATLNNNRAEIETGLQLPVQTVLGGGGNNGGVANAFGTVSVRFVRASLRLQVTPQVTFEGTILMNVNIEKDEPQFGLQVPGSPSAPIATRRASTRVRVADGGTAVIGGIYQVTANEGESRVPGLARIPVLGQLFKNRNRSNQNQELLIFITPRVIQQ